ncbi:MAG TPA: YeeE/YedE family protein [Xanthobacteraceae bacterium]|nr:YeeE/YedE family protein [Xanthobacteraceae bacterium]
MDNFTPVSALAGGLLIGTAAALLLVFNGKISGVSGILGGLFQRDLRDLPWRIAFLTGLIVAPMLYAAFGGDLPSIEIESSAGLLVFAGLLVGFGTRLGAGCTSGHGVCGIGRASPRSLVATAIFLTVAAATVFITRHLGG